MEVKASISYIRISPNKLRLLTVGLRGMSPRAALQKLQYYPSRGKIFLEKLIKQGEANAINNFKLPQDSLLIERLEVNEGPRIKRMDKSHGARFDRGLIRKRSSKLLLVLKGKEEKTEVIKKKEGGKPPSLKLPPSQELRRIKRRINGTKS